jgi:hypothetical protein
MATASMGKLDRTATLSGRELALASCEVRVWGMDTEEKPFIQAATARHMTEKGALLTGVLPVKFGDVVGLRYQERKARFRVTWVSDQDPAQTRSIGVDCIEDINFFGVRKQPIPIEPTSKLYSENHARTNADAPPNRRKAERFNCRVAADVALDNSVAQAHASVTDISRKGCYLQMVTPFPVGSGVGLSIYAKDLPEPLVVRGVVRTCHPMVGMGVEFSDVSPVDVQAMHTVLQQLGGPKAVKNEQRSAAWTPTAPENTASPEAFPMAIEIPSPRVVVMQISAELQKLETDTHSLRNAKLTGELRQAAMHVRNALHLCPAE